MSAFDLRLSIDNARKRLGNSARKARSDRGTLRVDPRVILCVERSLRGQERPTMRAVMDDSARQCRLAGLRVPSRATVYKIIASAQAPKHRVADLPGPVRAALYNLDEASVVPGAQLAFYCFNYGDLSAIGWAAGLPWLALYQAGRLPGHRAKSRGLLAAVLRARGIEDGRA